MNHHRFIIMIVLIAVSTLACNLPFASQLGKQPADETGVALTLTTTAQTVAETNQINVTQETSVTFTGTSESTQTSTPTDTLTSTATVTDIPPTSTFTPSPTPTSTDTPFVIFPAFPIGTGKISGFVFFDNNFNGVYNLESGELPAESAHARIMTGACPGGDIVSQPSSAANGVFLSPELNLGTYCVLVLPNGSKWGGNYVPTNSNERIMEVTLNNTVNAGIFGFRKQ